MPGSERAPIGVELVQPMIRDAEADLGADFGFIIAVHTRHQSRTIVDVQIKQALTAQPFLHPHGGRDLRLAGWQDLEMLGPAADERRALGQRPGKTSGLGAKTFIAGEPMNSATKRDCGLW